MTTKKQNVYNPKSWNESWKSFIVPLLTITGKDVTLVSLPTSYSYYTKQVGRRV